MVSASASPGAKPGRLNDKVTVFIPGSLWPRTLCSSQRWYSGALVSVLDRYAAPPTGIYAVFPQNRRLPLRVRLLIDYLRGLFGRPDYWRGA